jgi:hypothetical protein
LKFVVCATLDVDTWHLPELTWNLIRLTEGGEKYLEHPDNMFLFEVLEKNVLGFKEALLIIASGPCDIEKLHKKIVEELKESGECR